MRGCVGGDALGLGNEGGAGADDGVGAANGEGFHAGIGGHDEIAEETFFVGGGVGVFFENQACSVAAREADADGAGIFDGVDDGVAVGAGQSGGFGEKGEVENGFGERGADGQIADA